MPNNTPKYCQIIQEAMNFFGEKEYEKALALFEEARIIYPNNDMPYYFLEYLYKSIYKDLDKAINILLEMFENVSDIKTYYYVQVGNLYSLQKNSMSALEYYQKANNHYLSRIKDVKEILPENYFEIGFTYYITKDIINCEKYYEKALNLLSEDYRNKSLNFFSVMSGLFSRYFYNVENPDQKILNQFEEIGDINRLLKQELVLLYNRFKYDYETIRKWHQEKYNEEKYSYLTYKIIWEAYCYDKNYIEENKELALKTVKELVLNKLYSEPENERYYFDLSLLNFYFNNYSCLLNEKEVLKIETILLKRLNNEPENYYISYLLGYFYYEIANKTDMAIKYLEKTIEVNSNFDKPYMKLSEIYRSKSLYRVAIEYAEKFLELTDRKSSVYSHLILLKKDLEFDEEMKK